MSKQRSEDCLSYKQRIKLTQLHRDGMDLCYLSERFGVGVTVINRIVETSKVPVKSNWIVSWDDREGNRWEETFRDFTAAKRHSEAVSFTIWYVGDKPFQVEKNARSFARLTGRSVVQSKNTVRITKEF